MTEAANGFVIRRMERGELDFALGLAAAEGWNPGLADAESFWQADPEGYFLGLLDGRPVATISAVRYAGDGQGQDFGFIGLYIVVPEQRGRGLGCRLWDAALGTLTAPTIGLDAVLAQQANYCKSGFALAMRNCRYEGHFANTPGKAMPAGLSPLGEFPLEEVLAYDQRCFPARRKAFLRSWLSAPGHTALGLRRGDRLAGYGVVRPCGVGSKIGPLFADDDSAAHALFHGLSQAAAASAKGGQVFLDVPMPHAGAVRLAEAHDMRPVFETGRMYRGPAPDLDLGRVFGVTSFELG
ncbi:MAG: hypothetical protein A2051_11990 [Desulfovibrionales bacterium GWA2_65_9]|nr:MAG: hypothetical protein A2051_11990 [Desulfovibrionales bacterium GWA2_65_9]